MGEIEFRGQTEDGQWVYGDLLHSAKNYFICSTCSIIHFGSKINLFNTDIKAVKLETIGQFTGLCDKNSKKIYEGDICRLAIYRLGEKTVTIIWNNGFWISNPIEGTLSLRNFVESNNMEIEVIGNVHDNPELIKQ